MMIIDSNMLDLFVICNVPSSSKFELFCRYITREDVDILDYFEETLTKNYDLPYEFQVGEGYYDNTHYKHRCIEHSTFVDGFKFGIYDSYEDAVSAAQAYTAESLLEKYSAIYEKAKAEEEEKTRTA